MNIYITITKNVNNSILKLLYILFQFLFITKLNQYHVLLKLFFLKIKYHRLRVFLLLIFIFF